MMAKSTWILVLIVVFALLLLHYSFGAEWPDYPRGQPDQFRSLVNYDPKLSDPFFEKEEWTNGEWVQKKVDGRDVDTPQKCPPGKKKLGCSKITARCFSSLVVHVSGVQHQMSICEAKLLDGGRIELLINDPIIGDVQHCYQHLLIEVKEGVFWSQYWRNCERPTAGWTWTTKKQELTLDKGVYRKGDVIKGRIVFECLENIGSRRGVTSTFVIKVNGVFKTILE
jgi:hypothetical protein